jgi:hypothetical protein
MKTILKSCAVMLTAGLLTAVPVLAADTSGNDQGYDQQQGKDECLLVSMNCRDNVDTLQQRIQRLDREIGKGTSVYTNAELRRLQQQRDDNAELLRSLVESGGS